MATHKSPDDHWVDVVEGRGHDVHGRGVAMVNLGQMMDSASTTLRAICEGNSELKGGWLNKLKESAEEVYVELELAADMYSSVAPHVRDYGEVLIEVKSAMEAIVPEANAAWIAYQTALQEAQAEREKTPETEMGPFYTPEHATWQEQGDEFDKRWGQWDVAYRSACDGIHTGTSNAIEDRWSDNVAGAFDVVLKVLAVVGIILAIAALVIGGPIIAALALAVAVLTLALTAFNFAYGYASGWDLAFAIIGVIPFGSISKFATKGVGPGFKSMVGLSEGVTFADDASRWASMFSGGLKPSSIIQTMRSSNSAISGVSSVTEFLTGHTDDAFEAAAHLSGGRQAVFSLGVLGSHYSNTVLLATSAVSATGDAVDLAQMAWDHIRR